MPYFAAWYYWVLPLPILIVYLSTMKAVVYEKYGPAEVLQLREVPRPSPQPDEVLIKVHATSVTAGDWRLRKADPWLARLFNGLFRPRRVKILGFELAGVVEAVGTQVTTLKPGDEVMAFCGLRFGGYAEYACLKESAAIALKPTSFSYEEAATLPLGSLTALHFLQRGGLASGKRVLVYGASGSVGSYAVQLAKYYGAEVAAVCSTANMEMVRALGADRVLDYTRPDWQAGAGQYDLVFDAVGKTTKAVCGRLLASGAQYVTVKGQGKFPKGNLLKIREIAEKGALRPIIDRTYRLADIQEAHRYVEQFRKRGNVAVRVID